MPYNEQQDIDLILSASADWEKLKNASVLVTAATGRLGRYMVKALLGLNERLGCAIEVYALGRNAEKLNKVFSAEQGNVHLHFVVQNIIEPIGLDCDIDYIMHAAGNAAPKDYVDGAVDTLWGHVNGTRNVLEFARMHAVKRVLYVSTVEVYGEWSSAEKITEDDMGPLRFANARSCYPEAKRLCETMLSCYEAQYGVDYVTVRMSHTMGPGVRLDDGRAFAEFIDCVLKGEKITLLSDGTATRTYTYTADAIAAMFVVLTKGTSHWYNVANEDNAISIYDLAQLIVSLRPNNGSEVVFAPGVRKEGVSYLPFVLGILDASKIRALGWEPKVDVREAFERTISSFEE